MLEAVEFVLEKELTEALGSGRYERSEDRRGLRNSHGMRRITTEFGPQTLEVPRGRMVDNYGRTREFRSEVVPRRALRPLRKALRSLESNSLTQLEPEVWREELLAEAAASAIGEGQLEIDEALRQLLALWPATSHLDLGSGGDVGAALQLCPPARALLLRVASSTLAALGV